MTKERVLILGAGQAGAQAAFSLRQFGFRGNLNVLGDEDNMPYQRPPISKAYLKGELEKQRLYLKDERWYEEQNVSIVKPCRAKSIDRRKNRVLSNDGRLWTYDHLIIATGSTPRDLGPAYSGATNVLFMRTIDDADRFRPYAAPGQKVLVVGGGFIGLEASATARKLGAEVTLVERANRVLERVAGPETSDFFERLHRANGVELKTSTSIASIERRADLVHGVWFTDGTYRAFDVILIGIGVTPNDQIAREAGIECQDGIIVDENARSSVDNVYAVGDCARRQIVPEGEFGRLESVHNALEQGRQAAAAILGKPSIEPSCPWFWSDQYDTKLQIAGVLNGYDETIIRGQPENGQFSVVYLRNDRMVALDAINCPRDFMLAKKVIMNGERVDRTIIEDADSRLDLVAPQS